MTKNRLNPVDRVSTFAAIIAGVALMAMMVVGTADVLLGKVFDIPLPGALEGAEAFLVVSFFLALGYTQLRRGNISVEIFKSRLTRTKKEFLDLINYSVFLLLFSVLAWQGWKFALYSLRIREFKAGPINFPIYYAKLFAAIGLSIVVIQCLSDLIRGINRLKRKG